MRLMRRLNGCVTVTGCGCLLIWTISILGHVLHNVSRKLVTLSTSGTGSSRQGVGTGSSSQGVGTGSSRQGVGTGSSSQGVGTGSSRQGVGIGSSSQVVRTGLSHQGVGTGSSRQGVIAYSVNHKQYRALISPLNESIKELDLVVLVPTHYSVDAAERRRVIRKTWANKTYTSPLKVQHVFVLGNLILFE